MKYFFAVACLLFAMTLSTVQVSHAQYIVADPLTEEGTFLSYAEDLVSTAADVATEVNTYFSYLQESVLDPLANALIIVTQIQQQTNTINLITGSFNGNSLLIQNPEQWIKNKGLNSVKISIGNIAQQNGVYSNSLFGS